MLNGVWGVEGQFDVVRATFTDGTNVPRIPPMRLGGGVFYRDGNWLARVNLLHAFPQNDIAPNETPTAGYNLLQGGDQLHAEAQERAARRAARIHASASSATICSTRTSAITSPTPRTRC